MYYILRVVNGYTIVRKWYLQIAWNISATIVSDKNQKYLTLNHHQNVSSFQIKRWYVFFLSKRIPTTHLLQISIDLSFTFTPCVWIRVCLSWSYICERLKFVHYLYLYISYVIHWFFCMGPTKDSFWIKKPRSANTKE